MRLFLFVVRFAPWCKWKADIERFKCLSLLQLYMGETLYAVGSAVVGSNKSPVLAAEIDESDEDAAQSVNDRWHRLAQQKYDMDQGVVPEDFAETLMIEVMNQIEQDMIIDKDKARKQFNVAESVYVQLFSNT